MTSAPPSLTTFALAAEQVRRRVWLRRWLGWLGRTVWPVSALLALIVVGALVTGSGGLVGWGTFLFVMWLVGSATMATWKMPGAYSALAFWDSQTGRREAFASAWWFEQQTARTATEEGHLEQQRGLLPTAQKSLARDLPLPLFKRWLEMPLVLLVVIHSITLVQKGRDEIPLDEAMLATAKAEADKLAKTDWDKKNLAGLEESEKAELEKLKENLKATAASLENAQGQDARQVMSDLERRAREAEKLAERLGDDKDAWASEKLVQALRTHADTADLGDAAAAKNAAQTARAADTLAEQLKSPQLPETTRDRLNETLQEVEKAAEKEDRQRSVGQHVLQAGDEMKKSQSAAAGSEFEKLAEKMRDLALREKSREELEKLAQQLRDAGSNIAGQNDAGGMQQMNAANENSPQQQGQSGQTPQVGQAQAGQQSQQSLQPPGLGQMNQGQTMPQQNPGQQGQGQAQQMQVGQVGQAGQPGQQGQAGDQGTPMLMAPVPGQKPGDKPPDMFILGAPPGQPAEGAPSISLSMPGGRDPGAGKAELNADPSAKQDTTGSSVVTAQQNADGQSSVRAVEGGTRQESATRTASQTAVDFLQAEEEALDDAALPPSRREQVRRYFNELRRRFEKQP
ncbi:hypothetical protein EI77_03064 [Prosthecobacter fusiformis]|uniref:Uncharacterized protein n=1 Tax=Prosthecobacter fusiformis TaxID=48464 RepID=A0A4R7RUR1_9BACT|nr:hypothetical protein [Prosthecobacter fusiformis]TDU69411.1 hypothetical protein EI77_03064 [Prosthecobacter fusiformis]